MSSAATLKHRKFVNLLYRRTVDRNLKWNINDVGQLYVNVGSGTLFIVEGVNNQGEDSVVFKLFGSNGNMSESFSDDNLVYNSEVPEGFGNWYLLCSALFEMAKRQATGADDVLDSMIAELDNDWNF